MLYKTLKKLVDKGMTDELREKIDTFYALGRLSEVEYHSLVESFSSIDKIEE